MSPASRNAYGARIKQLEAVMSGIASHGLFKITGSTALARFHALALFLQRSLSHGHRNFLAHRWLEALGELWIAVPIASANDALSFRCMSIGFAAISLCGHFLCTHGTLTAI